MREQNIKKMVKTLTAMMTDCDAQKIKWSDIVEIAEHTWAVNNGKESWSCGSAEEDKTLEQMVK